MNKVHDTFMALGLLFTPVLVIWKVLNFSEPNGIKETLVLVLQITVSGIGGLGIGMILAFIYLEVSKKLDKEKRKK